jgi:23S rRNA U2552 (ribose-2'-O)-methylase RlmE/FtsJ
MLRKRYSLRTRNEEVPKSIFIEKKKIDFLKEFYDEMSLLKSKIDEKEKFWDKAKRKVNPFEMVNVIGTNILYTERNQKHDNYTPLSRAFFKMTEMYVCLDLIPKEYRDKPGNIANVAEGPGGFIEALYKQRKEYKDHFYGITLKSKNKNIPGWNQLYRRRKHFLINDNVHLSNGNLYNVKTIVKYNSNFKKKAFLVTGDGGFDYSGDFNNQEKNSHKIIFAEIVTCLMVQEKGGVFVCKMFDLFTYFSAQIIYFLSLLYEEVQIVKPDTSRPANSEKYIIAKNFRGISESLMNSMLIELAEWDKKEETLSDKTMFSVFNPKEETNLFIRDFILPPDFVFEIKQIITKFVEDQKEYIYKTLAYINHPFVEDHTECVEKWFTQCKLLKKNVVKDLRRFR